MQMGDDESSQTGSRSRQLAMLRIVPMNLGTDPNSTVIEHKLHKALFGENTWREDRIYEDNAEAFKPEAPQPPPVLHLQQHMKCLNIQVFVNCVGVDKDMVPLNEKIFHELQFDQIAIVLGK